MGVTGDAVFLAGIDLHVKINASINQGLYVGGGIAEEDVVIIQAVNYEQTAVKFVYAVNGRCIVVAAFCFGSCMKRSV